MEYAFTERIYRQGNRYFIRIPFNVYEKCNKKGVIPVRVMLEEAMFECRLIPKGGGFYVIPVSKAVAHSITCDRDINVSFEIIPELTRINHDSPYSIENPIFQNRILWTMLYRYAYRTACGRGHSFYAGKGMAMLLFQGDRGIELFWYCA